MSDYESMSEAKLRSLKDRKNVALDKLRSKPGNGERIRAARAEVLEIQAAIDVKQQERYAEYQRVADEGVSVEVAGEAASAVSEAERLLGGG